MTDFETSDRDVSRAIRSWLNEDRHEDASRIAGAVLDQVTATPRRRAGWPAWRTPTMNRFITFGLGAAAVIVIGLLLGSQLLGQTNTGNPGGVSPTPEATATVEPTPQPEGLLPEGPHVILSGAVDDSQVDIPRLTVTIPAPGWYGELGGGILLKNESADPPDGAGMIVFSQEEYIVYGDACHWTSSVPETPVTTVEELVDALSSQASREASEPIDVNLGGYAGKSITLRVPDDLDVSECDSGHAGSWDCGGIGFDPCGYSTGSTEIETVHVLDVDGVLVAWVTVHHPGTPIDVVAELEAIVQSATFGE